MSEDKIKVGDRVRSYDFEDSKHSYVEGVVEGFKEIEGCERYSIRVDRSVWRDEVCSASLRLNQLVHPPLNGTPTSMGGVCAFVEKL
jgi:hypothetical protein